MLKKKLPGTTIDEFQKWFMVRILKCPTFRNLETIKIGQIGPIERIRQNWAR